MEKFNNAERVRSSDDMQELYGTVHKEAEDRRKKGEDKDPLMALDEAIAGGENVAREEVEFILKTHQNGPWVISNERELQIFSKWCERAGEPVNISTDIEIIGDISLYRNDFGDCVMAESAKGKTFAVWTIKGRIQIGFKNQNKAGKFRASDPAFSMEATGNKRVGLVVIENGDTEDMRKKVAETLMAL